mmetsp:Transcript_70894/g.203119  ORF Transcript_70894/g.203119 Transcript_70894/m.203119 type:complete len:374 (+) Transcript_70894:56-1177(+)
MKTLGSAAPSAVGAVKPKVMLRFSVLALVAFASVDPAAGASSFLRHSGQLRGSADGPSGFAAADQVGGALPPFGAMPPSGAMQLAPILPASPQAPFGWLDASMKPPPPASPKAAHALGSGSFVFEWTRLMGSGLLDGRPEGSDAALCLTVADKKDTVGGFGLQLRTCESSIETFGARAINNSDATLRMAQEFVLEPTGRILSAGMGLCIRRMRCGSRFLYDVGDCSSPGYSASFEVKKPVSNSMDHLVPMGTVAHAVDRDRCMTCGPYVIVEKCLSRGKSDPHGHGGSMCGRNWQGKAGWTKWPATYLGDAAIEGRKPYIESIDTFGDRISQYEDQQKDMAGFTALDFAGGFCGSHVSDGPTMDSVFVLHRTM